jgi:hypothetical protein
MQTALAALACDYDGTIAMGGRVHDSTLTSLRRLRRIGCKLILVTGRELDDLLRAFARISMFDRVVVENGALVYTPSTRITRQLADPPPEAFDAFVGLLRARGVNPLALGRVIIATSEQYERIVLDGIRELALPLQVFRNKGALMVLPTGIDKGVGLSAALSELGVSPHRCVGVGDAENDYEFLSVCGRSVAVANAVPGLKERSDWVTRRSFGSGVSELVDRLIRSDLKVRAIRRGP